MVIPFVFISPSLKAEKYGLLYQVAHLYTMSDAISFDKIIEKYRPALDDRFKMCIRQTLQRSSKNRLNRVPENEAGSAVNHGFEQRRLWLNMMLKVVEGTRYKDTKDYKLRMRGKVILYGENGRPTNKALIAQLRQKNDKHSANPAESHLICKL